MFGKRLNYDDPIRQKMTRMLRESAMVGTQIGWQIFYPWLKKLMEFLGVGPVVKFSEPNIFLRNYIM